jgi:hypothetical protein
VEAFLVVRLRLTVSVVVIATHAVSLDSASYCLLQGGHF